jgi:hypothetical protein
MAYASQIHERTTVIAAEAITGQRIVAQDGTHTINKGIGVAEYDTASGSPIGVITRGVIQVESGGVFAAGDLLTSDADGKAVEADPAAIAEGSYQEIVGVAIDASSGAGQFPRIFVYQGSLQGINTEIKDETVLTAGEAITIARIVAADGTHTINKGIGVAKASAESAADVTVITAGEVDVETGGNFSVGDYITADADGKAVEADPAAVNVGSYIECIGIALEASTGTGQSKKVLLGRFILVGTNT